MTSAGRGTKRPGAAVRRDSSPWRPGARPAAAAGSKAHGVPRWGTALACAAIAAAAVLVNLPTVRYEFLNWDDSVYVVDNPWIRSWSRENLIHILTKPYFANYLPLHLLSYSFDHRLWGLNPFGYHLHQVLLNALNALLGFVVVRRLLGSFAVAALAGLFFAVHSSHVEAVAWVSSRKEVLSTTFLLLSLYLYLRARGSRSLRWIPYGASVVAFTMGLLSKISVIVLPLFLLIVDFSVVRTPKRERRFWLDVLGTKIPYGLIGLWLLHLASAAQVKAQAAYAHEPLRYLMVKGHAVWNYLGLLTGIRAANPDYDTPRLAVSFLPVVLNLAGLLVLPAIAWFAYRRGHRSLALGAGWVFATILPAVLFPLVTYMADRYLYAPSIGFCWALGAGVVALGRRVRSQPARGIALAALAAAPLAWFSYRTLEYNPVWRNSEALWTHAITKSKDYRAYNNLAQVRTFQKRWEEAERLLKLGARVENVTSYQSLGTLYYNTRRYDEAIRANDKALEILEKKGNDPVRRAELEYNRGAILWVLGRTDPAIEAWEAALRANPAHATAKKWLGTAQAERAKHMSLPTSPSPRE